mgnify:CR=1 FL=1
MITKIPLPNGKNISIEYNDTVFDPHYSHYRDTVGLADMCIKEVNPSRIVDVGTGTGVLAIALKKLNPFIDVYASDIDPNARKLAKKNAERNGVKITVLDANLLPQAQFYPVVVANLPKIGRAHV